MNREKILNRVKGILAKSENNPSEEESQAAIEKAQELMLKYNIELFEVERFEKPEYNHPDLTIRLGKKLRYEHELIIEIVSSFFFVKTVLRSCFEKVDDQSRSKFLIIYGRRHNVEVAQHIFGHLIGVYQILFKDFRNRLDPEKRIHHASLNRFRNDYYYGLSAKLHQRLTDLKAKQKDAHKNSWGLALVNEDKNIKEFIDSQHEKIGKASQRQRNHDPRVVAAGFKDGDSIQLNKAMKSGPGSKMLGT